MTFATVGEVSRRAQVVALVDATPHGELIPYEAIEMALGLDRPSAQAVVNQAKTSIGRDLQKALSAVTNVGYRVLQPSEHLNLAKKHQRKGRRQTRKAHGAVRFTDFTQLSADERDKFDLANATLAALERFEKRADLRYASREKVDAFIAEQSGRNERTAGEVQSMNDRLARLEKLIKT